MELEISEGISGSQINELIYYSVKDELILKTTQDALRFRNRNSFDLWIKKKRKIYSLHDKNDKLFGVIWFGKKKMPGHLILPDKFNKSSYGITFAIRIYADARGKGYAKTFMESAFEKYKSTSDYEHDLAKGIWLITNSDNLPAISAYKKFGFRKILEENNTGRVLMVFEEN